jgi:lipoprotein signal peptidase
MIYWKMCAKLTIRLDHQTDSVVVGNIQTQFDISRKEQCTIRHLLPIWNSGNLFGLLEKPCDHDLVILHHQGFSPPMPLAKCKNVTAF